MKKNILFSTTRQWNPGDEFILMGILNLFKETIGEFNPIIFNRNPEVRQSYQFINPFRKSILSSIGFRGKSLLESFLRIGFWDNSFKDEMGLDFVDMVVFAGSPEWAGKRLLPLYRKLLKYEKPIIYLGIGSGSVLKYSDLKSPYIDVLNKAKLITVRDTLTYNLLKPLNPFYLPCPALFSSPYEKNIKKVKKVGLIFGTNKAVINNKIDKESFEYILNLYANLIETFKSSFEFEMVCHYIDELPEAFKLYKGLKIHYSYNAHDYLKIYKNFDLVVGHRIHGIGICASMGIPGILVAHDKRGETGKGFLAEITQVGEKIDKTIDKMESLASKIEEKNKKLVSYKKEHMDIFSTLLRENIND